MSNKQKNTAIEIADLTFKLLANCQEKEERLSNQLDLTTSEFRTLRNFRNDRQITIRELTERAQLSGSRLTRILDGLEKKKIIVRTIDLTDRRSIMVTLTEEGQNISKDIERRYLEIHEEILKTIPKEYHDAITIGLKQLLQSLEIWLKQ